MRCDSCGIYADPENELYCEKCQKRLRSQRIKRISEWKGEVEDGGVTYIDGAVPDADGVPV